VRERGKGGGKKREEEGRGGKEGRRENRINYINL
jgi:hypothetical protein